MNTTTTKNEMMTLSDAARYIGVSRQTLYNWIGQGKLYPIRFMGLPYLPVTELNRIKKTRG